MWNPAVGEQIENGLPDTAEDFDGLYAWLAESKIFDIPQTHGFYATAPGTSDTMMGSGVWVTDNLRMLRADLLVLEKLVHGTSSYYQLRSRIDTLMANLSHYYQSHIVREKITAIFGDSAYYGQHISHGLPHIFRLSETDAVDGTPQFEPHGDWANHLRLESHATALLSFVRYQKLLPPPPNTTTIAKTIDDLVRFLVQIDFPQVLSSSAWEDAPFREVFADTALAARALEEALES